MAATTRPTSTGISEGLSVCLPGGRLSDLLNRGCCILGESLTCGRDRPDLHLTLPLTVTMLVYASAPCSPPTALNHVRTTDVDGLPRLAATCSSSVSLAQLHSVGASDAVHAVTQLLDRMPSLRRINLLFSHKPIWIDSANACGEHCSHQRKPMSGRSHLRYLHRNCNADKTRTRSGMACYRLSHGSTNRYRRRCFARTYCVLPIGQFVPIYHCRWRSFKAFQLIRQDVWPCQGSTGRSQTRTHREGHVLVLAPFMFKFDIALSFLLVRRSWQIAGARAYPS